MRTIAVVNQKGGVGKTTTTVNLAAALADAGRKVLIIDLDPQHSASTWYKAIRQGRGAFDLFNDSQTDLPGLVMTTAVDGVSIIPSSPLMYNVERALAGEPGAEHTLKMRLKQLPPGRFDYLLIDCPPSLGLLTVNALTAVDEVFVPVEAHVLGLHGLDKLVQTVNIVRERLNPSLGITGIVACRVKAQTRHAQEVISDIKGRFPDVFFQAMIRENVRLTECPSQGVPITIYAPTSHGAEDYRKLGQEVIAQEKGGRSVPKPKPTTISRDPYADDPYAFIGTPAKKEEAKAPEKQPGTPEPVRKPETEKITTPYPVELIERARNAAYWDRSTLAGIIVQALGDALDHMEAERGEPYPPRRSELRGGRPVGSGKGRNAGNA